MSLNLAAILHKYEKKPVWLIKKDPTSDTDLSRQPISDQSKPKLF